MSKFYCLKEIAFVVEQSERNVRREAVQLRLGIFDFRDVTSKRLRFFKEGARRALLKNGFVI